MKRLMYLVIGLVMVSGFMAWFITLNVIRVSKATLIDGVNPIGNLYAPKLAEEPDTSEAVEYEETSQTFVEKPKRHYERRLTVHHFQQGTVRV
jgi:hypothetical protein